ncbi:MAG: hypothetical protein LBF42_04055 [Puniceicoccales bacterium]|jgi:hypothetical protein|nr:hypothetical protein [Puniceicoccales bacterium]
MGNLVDFLLQKGVLFKVYDKLCYLNDIRGLCGAITKNASSGEILKSFLQYLQFCLSLWSDELLRKNFYFQNSDLNGEIRLYWMFLNKLASSERLRTELPSSIKYIKDELEKPGFDYDQLLAKIFRDRALIVKDGVTYINPVIECMLPELGEVTSAISAKNWTCYALGKRDDQSNFVQVKLLEEIFTKFSKYGCTLPERIWLYFP